MTSKEAVLKFSPSRKARPGKRSGARHAGPGLTAPQMRQLEHVIDERVDERVKSLQKKARQAFAGYTVIKEKVSVEAEPVVWYVFDEPLKGELGAKTERFPTVRTYPIEPPNVRSAGGVFAYASSPRVPAVRAKVTLPDGPAAASNSSLRESSEDEVRTRARRKALVRLGPPDQE